MLLKENIKAILECNFSIARDEVIEAATKRIMNQISSQNPLEDIRSEIWVQSRVDENFKAYIYYDEVDEIINRYMEENKL